MAVVDVYADSKWQSVTAPSYVKKRENISRGCTGSALRALHAVFSIAASDSVLSLYRLFASVPASYILWELLVCNDAMAGTTGVDFGLYRENGGPVVAQTAFSTGLSLAAAHNSILQASALNAYVFVPQTTNNLTKRLLDLAGYADNSVPPSPGAFDIGMKVTTSGGVAGNVAVRALFAEG